MIIIISWLPTALHHIENPSYTPVQKNKTIPMKGSPLEIASLFLHKYNKNF